jgi:tetratricopeptide (TPR) repeat protein
MCAELAERLGFADDAARCYERVFRFTPAGPAAFLSHATFLARQGNHAEALGVLARGVARHPADAALGMSHAAALQGLGHHGDCVEALDRFVGGGRGQPEMHLLRGKSLHELGRHSEALTEFDEARRLQARSRQLAAPAAARFVVAEAGALHCLGRTGEAVDLLERLCGHPARGPREVCELLGQLHELSGQPERAERLYADALRHYPRSPALQYGMARVNAAEGRKPAALRQLAAALALDPGLAAAAADEPAFQRYWFSPSMLRLLGWPLARRQARLISMLAAVAAGAGGALWWALTR